MGAPQGKTTVSSESLGDFCWAFDVETFFFEDFICFFFFNEDFRRFDEDFIGDLMEYKPTIVRYGQLGNPEFSLEV
jgi:hypothetical protein